MPAGDQVRCQRSTVSGQTRSRTRRSVSRGCRCSNALEQMEAPGGVTMSAYAKAVVQERTAQIAAQYEEEAIELLRWTRAQALELLDDVVAAVSADTPSQEILDRLHAIRHRVAAP